MPTLEIGGRRVEVPESFRSMSPELQQKTVDEIADQLGLSGPGQGGLAAPSTNATVANGQPDASVGGEPGVASSAAGSPPDQGLGAGRSLLYGTQKAARGLGDIVFGVPDIVNAGLNAVIGAYNFAAPDEYETDFRLKSPSDAVANVVGGLAEQAGVPLVRDEEVPWQQRVVGEAARFGTAAFGGAGALASRTARQAMNPGQPVDTSRTAEFLNKMSEPYRGGNARAVIGDTAAGVGSGASIETANQLAPGIEDTPLGPVAQILAGIAGGVTGSFATSAGEGIGRAVINQVKRDTDPTAPIDAATGQLFRRRDLDRAGLEMQGMATNPATAGARINERLNEMADYTTPGTRPTTGALSDDVGLAIGENQARMRNPGPFIERYRNVQTEAGSKYDDMVPRGADGRAMTDFIDSEAARREITAKQAVTAAEDALETAERGVVPNEPLAAVRGTGGEASKALDRRFRDVLDAETARKNELYNDPALQSAQVDPAPLVETADDITASLGPVGDPESVPTELINRINRLRKPAEDTLDDTDALIQSVFGGSDQASAPPKFENMTYADVLDLRAQIGTEIGKARTEAGQSQSGSGQRVDNLIRLRKTLDGYIDDLAQSSDPAVAQAAQNAVSNYRENFAPRFRQGQAGDFRAAIRSDQTGTRTRPSDTAGRFLGRNKPEDAESLARALDFDNNPQAVEEARTWLLDDLASSGALDPQTNQLRPDAVRRWAEKNQAVIDKVPGTRKQVDEALERAKQGEALRGSLADEVKARRSEAYQTDRELKTGAFKAVVGKDPKNAVASIFQSKRDPGREMDQLVDLVKDNPEAKDGLKAAVRDYLIDQTKTGKPQNTTTGEAAVNVPRLRKVSKQHEKTLAKIYTPEQMNKLRQAQKMLEPFENLSLRATTGSPTAENWFASKAGKAFEAALKLRYGQLKGGGYMRAFKVAAESLPDGRRNVSRIVEQAFLDPELAAHLMQRDIDQLVGTPDWNSKLNRLLAYSTGARETGAEDEPLFTQNSDGTLRALTDDSNSTTR